MRKLYAGIKPVAGLPKAVSYGGQLGRLALRGNFFLIGYEAYLEKAYDNFKNMSLKEQRYVLKNMHSGGCIPDGLFDQEQVVNPNKDN